MSDRLLAGQSLKPGERITSPNGTYYVTLQKDGNIVLYNRVPVALWAPDTDNVVIATMQADGNFVGYAADKQAAFATNTQGNPGAWLQIQDDGNLVVYSKTRIGLWTSSTEGGRKATKSGGGFFGKVAHTLGGAASGLATGVASAAKISGKAFTQVTNNPVWKIAAVGIGVAIPGIGTAVSAGMLVASKVGAAAASADSIIGAAKNGLGSLAEKAAFEVGTGIAVHGAGMSGEDLQVVRNQIPDGAPKAAFDAALVMHAGRASTAKPAPANLSPDAKAAYYATKGLINTKAPATTKKAVVKSVASSARAKAGVHAAIQASTPQEMSYLSWILHEVKQIPAKLFS